MKKKLSFADFAVFEAYDQEVLAEIVREGELEMQSRLITANSADRRSLALLALQTTGILALAAASFALLIEHTTYAPLGWVAIIEVSLLTIAAFYATESIRPALYCFPGNDPKNWKLADWHFKLQHYGDATLKKAMVEQCFCIHSGLFDNQEHMERKANNYKNSIDITLFSVMLSVFLVVFGSVLSFLLTV